MASPARKIPRTHSSQDRTSSYAREVVAGRVVAGPHVRNACRRHLEDLEKGPDRGLTFDFEEADRVFGYFENVLKLSEGQFDGKPFELHPSQAFILGSLFGWLRSDGTRRFRRAYIEQGKGNGKSPLAAGIGLYGLTADDEAGAQVYAAAAKKEQSGILFADAVKMVRASPALSKRIEFSGGEGREYNIAHHASGSFFRPVSRDTGKTGSGPRPYFVLADEVHELPDGKILEMLERGFKFRRQPLLFMITNSGSDRNSICWAEHEWAIKVAAGNNDAVTDPTYVGEVLDDTTFAYVCSLDGPRTEKFAYSHAMAHMRTSCTCKAVSITQTDQLLVEAFVKAVTSAGIGKKAESGVKLTLSAQSERQESALSATRSLQESEVRKQRLSGANIRSDGSRRTESDFANTSGSGYQKSQDTDWQSLRSKLLELTESLGHSSTSSSKSKTESAQSAVRLPNGFASTIVTALESIEDCSVNPAIQESVFSEILQRVWSAHSYTCEVRRGKLEGPRLKVEVPADDPLNDPSCWPKANPLLGVTITEEYLAAVVAQAKNIPAKQNGILRLHFCVWTDAESAWMSREAIEPLIQDFDPAIHRGADIFGGLDLSQNRDITAAAFVAKSGSIDVPGVDRNGKAVTLTKPTFDAWIEAWTPGDTMKARFDRDKIPYPIWASQGHIHAPPGDCINYRHVAQTLVEYDRAYKIRMIAYDRYAFRKFEDAASELGIVLPYVEHPQGGTKKGKPTPEMEEAAKRAGKQAEGLWFPGSLRMLEDAILEKRIRFRRNPVLISAIMSAVVEKDKWDNGWLSKQRSVNKIDAAVAMVMAFGAAMALPGVARKLVMFTVGGK